MTDEVMKRLEELAKAATPGPWHWVNPTNDEPRKAGEYRSSLRTVEEWPAGGGYTLPEFVLDTDEIRDVRMEENAGFIAAANPAAVLALIERVRRAEDKPEWFMAELRRAENMAFEQAARGVEDAPSDFNRNDHADRIRRMKRP